MAARKVLANISVITEKLGRLISWHQSDSNNGLLHQEEQPLRSELFNVEQLERHAKTLAASHQLAAGCRTDKLIARLNENERILVQTYELVTEAAKRNSRPARAVPVLAQAIPIPRTELILNFRLMARRSSTGANTHSGTRTSSR